MRREGRHGGAGLSGLFGLLLLLGWGGGEGAELGQAGLCGRTGLLKMPRLDLVFAEVTEKNVEQLRLMNELIFPVRYNDQFYKDAYKNLKLAQFGAPTRVDLPAPPTFAARARGAQRQR